MYIHNANLVTTAVLCLVEVRTYVHMRICLHPLAATYVSNLLLQLVCELVKYGCNHLKLLNCIVARRILRVPSLETYCFLNVLYVCVYSMLENVAIWHQHLVG